MDKPNSQGCCKDGFFHNAPFLLEVKLNGNWWHFKCCNTIQEARRWKKWRSEGGSEVRIVTSNVKVNGRERPYCERSA